MSDMFAEQEKDAKTEQKETESVQNKGWKHHTEMNKNNAGEK